MTTRVVFAPVRVLIHASVGTGVLDHVVGVPGDSFAVIVADAVVPLIEVLIIIALTFINVSSSVLSHSEAFK